MTEQPDSNETFSYGHLRFSRFTQSKRYLRIDIERDMGEGSCSVMNTEQLEKFVRFLQSILDRQEP